MKRPGKDLNISVSGMRRIARSFHSEMDRGLAGKKSSLKMIRAYVKRPSGAEKGIFLALDLGGTNFRVLELELKGDRRSGKPVSMKFAIDKKTSTGEGRKLFDFIASCVKRFLACRGELSSEIGMGFTFSFPVRQTAIDAGRLLYWTKEFSASGVIGRDVVGLLESALERSGIRNVRVSALVNDTVGTLVAKSYEDSACDVGVILGTGTNACYVEESLDGMIVNIEWGNFNKLPMTRYDRALDGSSGNKGMQILEKMVSGMYLGEIAGLVMKEALGAKAPTSFRTEELSAVLNGQRIAGLDKKETALAGKICGIVALRSARISAAALAAVITRMDPKLRRRHTVAIDGSVYEKLPGYAKNMRKALAEIFGRASASRIRMTLAKDGSGRGAAVIAAVADA